LTRAIAEAAPVFPVVFFDLDDTLFDRGAAFERYAREYLQEDDPDELRWLAEADARGRRSRLEFARDVLARRWTMSDREPEQYAAAFLTSLVDCIEPEPGVRDAVAALARSRRVAIVTNGGALTQREKLRRLGLADIVRAVFVSEEVGAAKPERVIFERALAWSEHPASACLFVGDDPWRDIAPAAALGMATAWRSRGEVWPPGLPPPRFAIASIAEVAEL
jgi:HAD superfamily hydrolase (TIGR01549 family)